MHCSSAVLLCHTRSTAPHSPTWGKRTDSQQIVPARPPSALLQAAEACDKCAKAPIQLAKCRQGFRSGTKDGPAAQEVPYDALLMPFPLGKSSSSISSCFQPMGAPQGRLYCSHAHPTPPFSITCSSTITVYDGKGARLGRAPLRQGGSQKGPGAPVQLLWLEMLRVALQGIPLVLQVLESRALHPAATKHNAVLLHAAVLLLFPHTWASRCCWQGCEYRGTEGIPA